MKLAAVHPPLAPQLLRDARGELSIDFANALSVRALNQALLKHDYAIAHFELPAGYLCPPIPGRADYVHVVADLLASTPGNDGAAGSAVRVLDIGVGANCIYPLLGQREYGWQFVGADINTAALAVAQQIIDANHLTASITLRHQAQRGQIFTGVIQPDDVFALTMCNPPFHASATEVAQHRRRKWAGLGKADAGLNFGGQDAELWCTGGEASFVKRMVQQSAAFGAQVRWFSSLIARAEHLYALQKQLSKVGALEVRILPMAQGNKLSRVLAWRFM
jgi:23S rRNA (adenine1618-N6)-methyltransferase